MDRPPGDLAGAARLAHRVAGDLGLADPELLKAGMNATFGAGDVVIRVGRPTAPASAAYDLVGVLESAGVRVPAPAAGELVIADDSGAEQPLVATVWERLQPTGDEPDWYEVGRMVRLVNELDRTALPAAYPVPRCTSFPWWQFDSLLAEVAADVDASSMAALGDAVERNRRALAEPLDGAVCHGDVHPGNVVATADGPVIIDWDLLCVAPVAWDHAPLLSMVARWGTSPSAYTRFAAGYGADLSADALAAAYCELRLVAATLMRVLAGRADAAARAEAQRRLAWWRDEDGAPTWALA